jgi:hypothetical protein
MHRRLRAPVMLAAALATVVGLTADLRSYLKLGYDAGGTLVGLQWTQQPIRYSVTNRDVPGATAAQLQAAVANAFGQWSRPASVEIASQFSGFTAADPFVEDSVSVIGFKARPDLDRTLGATTFVIDDPTGAILEADIFLNSTFAWSAASGGEANKFDVESVIVHELGHFLGLGHTALGETELRPGGGRAVLGKRAVMFPIAYPAGSIADRTLQADDIAGITDLYGDVAAQQDLGAIQGRVTLNGKGVFGAHVTAFNPATGDLVSGFTLNGNGDFVIASLVPGQYVVRVEPMDDVDADTFFDSDTPVNVGFRVTYHARPVAVPAGGAGAAITIAVKAK